MSKETPGWLPEVTAACRSAGIEIAAWGPDTLVVKVSPERGNEVVSQLRPWGFAPIEDPDDAESGLLELSRSPAATHAKPREKSAEIDLSRRPLLERVTPVFGAALSIVCFWNSSATAQPTPWLFVILGPVLLIASLSHALRFWGWRLQMSPRELRVRRNFRWTAIPWREIRAANTIPAWGRNQEAVILTLAAHATISLGTFSYPFARALRNRLREAIAGGGCQR
jgi:hypothetical protein